MIGPDIWRWVEKAGVKNEPQSWLQALEDGEPIHCEEEHRTVVWVGT